VELGSRHERPLTRYFPELVAAAGAELPERCVIDGEIVIAAQNGLDFEALRLRLHPAARVRMLAEQTPAAFIAFVYGRSMTSLFRADPLSGFDGCGRDSNPSGRSASEPLVGHRASGTNGIAEKQCCPTTLITQAWSRPARRHRSLSRADR